MWRKRTYLFLLVFIFTFCSSGFASVSADEGNIINIDLTSGGSRSGALFGGGMPLAPGVSQNGIMRINNQTGQTVTVRSLALSQNEIRGKDGAIIADKENESYKAFVNNIEFDIKVKFGGLIPYSKTVTLGQWMETALELGVGSTKIKNGQSVDIDFTVKMLGGAGNAAQGVSAKADITAVLAGDKDDEDPVKPPKDKDDDDDGGGRAAAAVKEPEKPKHIHIFNDIDGHWAEDYIHKLGCDLGYVNGYGDGTFRPDRNIARAEAAKIIVNVKKLKPEEGKTGYKDRLFFANWAKPYIYTATKHGIAKGYPDGQFKPKKEITRDEAVAMIIRAFYDDKEEPASILSGVFNDEKTFPMWSKGYLTKAYKEGIINGYPDGSFKPLGKITRAEFVSIIVRYLDKE
ncbi:S-layer homology domain-containing protein [Lutispora saccharofermentans]|uniref:S-layer homology domain-containing protein n=1 Tax=Lutispora saccharofermentans TaxID=3024236 RepID=A0ABT1NBL1_9FIRM|nr:S-layer homology domain-containing protein [Lutispora saccharofermentans]MCQ1528647.1 S-layer homology domain-containing protein [Lutispora saccharofermentans]